MRDPGTACDLLRPQHSLLEDACSGGRIDVDVVDAASHGGDVERCSWGVENAFDQRNIGDHRELNGAGVADVRDVEIPVQAGEFVAVRHRAGRLVGDGVSVA